MKIVLIGAGSAQFGFSTLGEIFQSEHLAGSQIVLHDINPETLAEVTKSGRDFIEEHSLPFQIEQSVDRKKALEDAEHIVISIEVGDRFELWELDWKIPQQYGIRQIYGENGGPGGLFHSLRIIPPILEICADIARICPDAYIFNVSNPMSRICTTVHRAFPKLRFIGLCHEIASLERYLPSMLDLPFEQMDLQAAGLNHFSCLLTARHKETDRDLYPEIIEKSKTYFASVAGASDYFQHMVETGRFVDTEGAVTQDEFVGESAREWTERRLFKFILENYELLPITTDSHFGEYLPWAYQVSGHQGIIDFYRYYKSYLLQASAKIELKLKERIVPMIEALTGADAYTESAVNIPNDGYIRELPDGIAVEVPAHVSKTGVSGVQLPAIPMRFAALLQNQVGIHNMTAEAVLSRSRKAVVHALLADPVCDQANNLSRMVEIMIRLQEPYLSYLE